MHANITSLLAKTSSKYILLFWISLCEYIFPLFITLLIGGFVSISSFFLLAEVVNVVDVKAFVVNIMKKIKLQKHNKNKKRAKNQQERIDNGIN